MKKFSYAKEFNNFADIVRIGKADDVRIGYSVFVGNPDNEDETFLGEVFSADDFTTWSDAAKAKQLVVVTLQQVDKNLAMGLKLSDVRDEVIAAIVNKKNDGAITPLKVTRAINKIFDYYISHGA